MLTPRAVLVLPLNETACSEMLISLTGPATLAILCRGGVSPRQKCHKCG